MGSSSSPFQDNINKGLHRDEDYDDFMTSDTDQRQKMKQSCSNEDNNEVKASRAKHYSPQGQICGIISRYLKTIGTDAYTITV